MEYSGGSNLVRDLYQKVCSFLWGFQRPWLNRIRVQVEGAGQLLHPSKTPDSESTIVIFSLLPWHHGVVEHLLAKSLSLKGTRVHTIICSGGFPVCGNESAQITRPPCTVCLNRTLKYTEAFKLDCQFTRDFIGLGDVQRATQLIDQLGDAELVDATYEGIEIGKIAFRDLSQYFHFPVIELGDKELPVMRKSLVTAILNVELARQILLRHSPQRVIISNGKSISYAGIYSYLITKGVDVITWDESPVFRNGFTFNRDVYAAEVHLEDVWERESTNPLTERQERLVDEYFKMWRIGRNARYQYHEDSTNDSAELQEVRNNGCRKKIVTFFSNLTWETSHLGRNIGFTHLLDCIFFLIDYVKDSEKYHLVVRAHPAETKVPEHLRTVIPLEESIKRRYNPIPANLTILTSSSNVNSYGLADNSDLTCVYTSTIGLEIALRGRKCLVLGDCHYRRKGFTIDIDSREDLRLYLDAFDHCTRLSPAQVDLAKRYAYLWVFRHVVRIPYLDERTRSEYKITSVEDLVPGSDSVIDRLTEKILHGESFLDVSDNAHNTSYLGDDDPNC